MPEDKVYLITKMQNQIFSFLLHGNRAVEIHCDEEERGSDGSILGNIYIGRIRNIAKNIGAAFVEIAPGTICYLALDQIRNPIYTKKGGSRSAQAGDELLVQVLREGIKTKAPALTTNLTLYGKYALLTTGNTQISASSKLPATERRRLIQYALNFEEAHLPGASGVQATGEEHDSQENEGSTGQELNRQESAASIRQERKTSPGQADTPRAYGWLLRTNAGNVEEALLEQDLSRLLAQYQSLMAKAQHLTCYTCLAERPKQYLNRLSGLYTEDADRIVTDDPVLYREISAYLGQYQPEDLPKLSFYEDRLLPMPKLYSLERHLREALSERVWLKSGGYLVIQPTEALTVIDVNTGKCETGKQKEQTFLRINLEAATEIARQLRLRNLSGIIIVDFINMEPPEHEQKLLAALGEELRRDPVPTVLVDMTRLSLVELTRMKRERPLHESIRNTPFTHASS